MDKEMDNPIKKEIGAATEENKENYSEFKLERMRILQKLADSFKKSEEELEGGATDEREAELLALWEQHAPKFSEFECKKLWEYTQSELEFSDSELSDSESSESDSFLADCKKSIRDWREKPKNAEINENKSTEEEPKDSTEAKNAKNPKESPEEENASAVTDQTKMSSEIKDAPEISDALDKDEQEAARLERWRIILQDKSDPEKYRKNYTEFMLERMRSLHELVDSIEVSDEEPWTSEDTDAFLEASMQRCSARLAKLKIKSLFDYTESDLQLSSPESYLCESGSSDSDDFAPQYLTFPNYWRKKSKTPTVNENKGSEEEPKVSAEPRNANTTKESPEEENVLEVTDQTKMFSETKDASEIHNA